MHLAGTLLAVDEEPTDSEVLLEIYRQLRSIKALLIGLVVVVVLFGSAALFDAAQDRSERRADAKVECLLEGRQNC
jgi:hypothetical protein